MFAYSPELGGYILFFTVVLPVIGLLWGRTCGHIDWFHPITAMTLYASLMLGYRTFYIIGGYSHIVREQSVLMNGLRLLAIFFVLSLLFTLMTRRLFHPRFHFRCRGGGGRYTVCRRIDVWHWGTSYRSPHLQIRRFGACFSG